MSSQALATAPLGGGGLPSAPSPPTTAPPQMDESWDSHMQDLESQSLSHEQKEANSPQTQDGPSHDRTPSISNTNGDDRVQQHRQALSNLMAALNQSGGTKAEQTDASNSLAPQGSQQSNTNVVPNSDNHPVTSVIGANNPSTPPPPPQPTTFAPMMNGTTSTDLPPLPFDSNISPPAIPPQDFPSTLPFPDMDMTTPAAPRIAPRKIGAFAKLNFDDGHYYMSTYQIELGRDAIAYQDALRREKEEKDGLQLRAQSSSGRMSRHSDRIKRGVDSQVQGSVVSEAGGFAGLDDMPVGTNESGVNHNSHPSQSSQLSQSDVINPNDLVLAHNFDYAKRGDEVAAYEGTAHAADGEQPAPVTAEHMPDPSICPLIPIHAMTDSDIPELTTHKMISRRHARIEWSVRDESFVIETLGRNGVFVDKKWHGQRSRRLLKHGSLIQIAGIQIRFELPRLDEPELDHDASLPEYDGASPERPNSITPISTAGTPERTTPVPKVTLKLPNKKDPSDPTPQPLPLLGPDGQPIIRKRGPGRPPKDGIMSTRERKEREKAAKAAEAKAANGGTTPPPMARGKILKPPTKEELARFEAARQEKKKVSTTAVKRRREEDGEVLPSIEGGEENVPSDSEKQPVKKARQSKSPSPEYPALASLTEEQLARPSEPYARLIYDILIEIYPKALPLKQIYRAIKSKFPFFVHRVESDGWQSSVRHNLNQEWNKLFEKGEKEGKGFAWKAIPGALQPQAERKRAAQAAAAAKPKPQQQRQHNQQASGNWNQNQSGSWPPNGFQPPPNGMPWPPPQGQPPRPFPAGQNAAGRPPAQVPPPAPLPAPGASNMPCTLDGFLAIRRFEQVMYDLVEKKPASNGLDRLRAVFNSIKARVLHGAPASTLPGVETREEKAIMNKVKAIVERFKNPAFQGYQVKPLSRGQSPAVHGPTGQGTSRPQNGPQAPKPPYAPPQVPPRQPSTPLARSMSATSVPPSGQMPQKATATATATNYPSPAAPYSQQRPNTPNANAGPAPQGPPYQQHRTSTPNGNGGPAAQMQRPPSAAPYPQQTPHVAPGPSSLQNPQGAAMQQHSPAPHSVQMDGQAQRPPSQVGQQHQQQPGAAQRGHQQAFLGQPNQQQQGTAQRGQQQRPPTQPVSQQHGPTQHAIQQGASTQAAQQQQIQTAPPQHQHNAPLGNVAKSSDVNMSDAPPHPSHFQTVGQAASSSAAAAANNTPAKVPDPMVNGNTPAVMPTAAKSTPVNGDANDNHEMDSSGDVQMSSAPALNASTA